MKLDIYSTFPAVNSQNIHFYVVQAAQLPSFLSLIMHLFISVLRIKFLLHFKQETIVCGGATTVIY